MEVSFNLISNRKTNINSALKSKLFNMRSRKLLYISHQFKAVRSVLLSLFR